MTGPIADRDLGAADLREIVDLGLARGAALLTGEERDVAERILAAEGAAARWLARLSARVGDAHRVPVDEDGPAACAALCEAGLLRDGADWPARVAASPNATLRAWCRASGAPVSGARPALVARLVAGPPVADEAAWVTWPHRRLLTRLERFATLRKEPDRGLRVAERLGHVAWPSYALTSGGALFPDRVALLAWEALLDAHAEGSLTVDAALDALRTGAADAPGPLSLRRRMRRFVVDHVEALLRGGDGEAADALLADLEEAAGLPPHRLAPLRARARERAGDARGALDLLVASREGAPLDAALGLERSARRLARAGRGAFAPLPPVREAPTRDLRLEPGASGGVRPRWRAGDDDALIERAVQQVVADAGRPSVRAEGPLARTLFALLFADALLAPVPGALPVPRLAGPLDLGSPGWAARRAAWIFPVLDDLAEGRAPARVQAACARFAGIRLAGLDLPVEDPAPLVAAAEALGPAGLRALLVPLLRDGPRAAAGLPDLLVLPGPEVRLPGSFPARLGSGALFVEVKGPGDALRDGQRAWIHELLGAGGPVEVWRVAARPPTG